MLTALAVQNYRSLRHPGRGGHCVLSRWLRQALWHPFELACRWLFDGHGLVVHGHAAVRRALDGKLNDFARSRLIRSFLAPRA